MGWWDCGQAIGTLGTWPLALFDCRHPVRALTLGTANAERRLRMLKVWWFLELLQSFRIPLCTSIQFPVPPPWMKVQKDPVLCTNLGAIKNKRNMLGQVQVGYQTNRMTEIWQRVWNFRAVHIFFQGAILCHCHIISYDHIGFSLFCPQSLLYQSKSTGTAWQPDSLTAIQRSWESWPHRDHFCYPRNLRCQTRLSYLDHWWRKMTVFVVVPLVLDCHQSQPITAQEGTNRFSVAVSFTGPVWSFWWRMVEYALGYMDQWICFPWPDSVKTMEQRRSSSRPSREVQTFPQLLRYGAVQLTGA